MIIPYERDNFDTLPIDAIGHACFEPMIPVYQGAMRGQSGHTAQEIRIAFYQTLSPGQRALFMLFSYLDHATQSIDEFQRISHYYLSAQIFGAVKKGAEYFHDIDLLHLLSTIERTLFDKDQIEAAEQYHRLKETLANSLVIIGKQIKENPAEFICFE